MLIYIMAVVATVMPMPEVSTDGMTIGMSKTHKQIKEDVLNILFLVKSSYFGCSTVSKMKSFISEDDIEQAICNRLSFLFVPIV